MGQPVILTVSGAIAADADGIAQSQTPGAAGNLTINGANASGGVATITAAGQERPVLLTTAADETTKTFTAYGLNATGSAISSSVAGVNNSTVQFPLNFYKVTRVAVSAATAGAVTVGTTNAVYTRTTLPNMHAQPVQIGIQCDVTGTVDFDLEYSLDDPNGSAGPAGVTWITDADIDGDTANVAKVLNIPIQALRLKLNSGSGSVVTTMIQAGLTGS
jgi:VCBS repeat-containing protein